ncbi:NUDIX domain-containing protein [Patescibacteria group bacterium]|nr:NUDIX domain-containing protein [Patescibacteria group bacterium]
MPLEKSAGAIIFRRNKKIKYLLIQYGWGHWEFPRGLIEKGESLEDTARREIKEEVGIEDIRFIPGFKEWIKFFFKLKGKNIMKIATFLLAQTKTEEVKLSYEHKDYTWLPYEEALNRLTFKNSKEILKKANDYLKLKMKNEK